MDCRLDPGREMDKAAKVLGRRERKAHAEAFLLPPFFLKSLYRA